jgi:hypothetical protein
MPPASLPPQKNKTGLWNLVVLYNIAAIVDAASCGMVYSPWKHGTLYPKWFDKLTILSNVEGHISITKSKNSQTIADCGIINL